MATGDSHRPLIVQANRYRFAPGESVDAGVEQTRMQLWCRHGRGTLWVDDRAFPITPHQLFLLPWGSRRRYRAARRDPCDLCGVHLVPRHGRGRPYWRALAIDAGPARSDAPLDGLEWPLVLPVTADDPLIALGTVALDHFGVGSTPMDEESIRLLSTLLWREWARVLASHARASALSPALARLRSAQLAALHTAIDLPGAARIVGCSPATLTRRCQTELGASPMAWLRGLRLTEARRQLVETGASADHIARACGFRDGDHLARCLRQAGEPGPRELRRRSGRGV